MTREKDTATHSKNTDSKYESVDVVKERTRTEADRYVLPAHFPGLVPGVPEVFMYAIGTEGHIQCRRGTIWNPRS